jgi:hypothetical protein
MVFRVGSRLIRLLRPSDVTSVSAECYILQSLHGNITVGSDFPP